MRLILIVVLGLGAIFLFIRMTEGRMIFFPMKTVTASPAHMGIPNFEKLSLRTQDGVILAGWFIPSPGARYTILFLHGNAGNIGHRIEKIKILHDLGSSVLIVDYRGYGESQGRPTERGLYRDAQAAYRYLTNERHIPESQILLYGESLGGAVAVDLATRVACGGLVIESTFTSIPDMAKEAFPFVPRFVLGAQFDSLSKIGQVKCRKLFLHSIGDEIIPYEMAQRLYAAASEPKTKTDLIGGHNTAFIDAEPAYRAALKAFTAP